MSVPPLRLISNFEPYISGEVTIHPTATVAPGVILQASPNSKIIIGEGVCIGMGAILQVYEGTIEVEAGSILGAGFLMVGAGRIGANACIGTSTTIINCSVEPSQVIVSGSILGDTSRQINLSEAIAQEPAKQPEPTKEESEEKQTTDVVQEEEEEEDFWAEKDTVENYQPLSSIANQTLPSLTTSNKEPETTTLATQTPDEQAIVNTPDNNGFNQDTSEVASNNFGTNIYGKSNIQRLLITLFPHRQSLSNELPDGKSE